MSDTSSIGKVTKIIGAIAAILIGLVLLFSASDSVVAEAIFVGTIVLVCGVYSVNGTSRKQGVVIATILFLLAAYLFAKAFNVFEDFDSANIRRVAGIFSIVSGLILVIPIFRKKSETTELDKPQ